MTPQTCTRTHNPPHSYGDCLRACVATVMDFEPQFVPHFADRGATADEALSAAREWLRVRHLTVARFLFPGDELLSDVMEWMGTMNPTVTSLLFGRTSETDQAMHVNVCVGGEVVHDPAWVPTSIKAPYREDGQSVWQIWVITRL